MRMSGEPKVILVNFQDQQTGVMGKMKAHQEARLHRAFLYSYTMATRSFCKNGQKTSITAALYGQTPVAPTLLPVRVRMGQLWIV